MAPHVTSAQHLLGGYFHQDWTEEFADAEEAIAAMLDGEPADRRHAAAAELRALLAAEPDAALPAILRDRLGCYYAGPGGDERAWLAHLAARLSA